MKKIFFSYKRRIAYKKSVINSVYENVIQRLQSYNVNGINLFNVVKRNGTNNEYTTHDIDVYGVQLFSIVNRETNIQLQAKYGGYQGIDTDLIFSSYTILNLIYVLEITNNPDILTTHIFNLIVVKHLGSYIQSIKKELTSGIGEMHIDQYDNDVRIEYKLEIKSNTTDSRFVKLYSKECDVYERITIPHSTPYEEVNEMLKDLVLKVTRKRDSVQAKYDNIRNTIGGVVINVDGQDILCDKRFKPLITGGFITFKCPYTGSMVSLKSTKYDCVIVTGMDEVYGTNDSIVLIGNN